MAASLKGKRTPITTPPYQVPSVDISPDPPIFSLVTTFKKKNSVRHRLNFVLASLDVSRLNKLKIKDDSANVTRHVCAGITHRKFGGNYTGLPLYTQDKEVYG